MNRATLLLTFLLLFSFSAMSANPSDPVSPTTELLPLDHPVHDKPWRANWIWSDVMEENTFVQFRKSFELDEAISHAPLRICSETAYLLYVNGVKVLRGPLNRSPKGEPSNYYDHLDLAPYLKKGSNNVAVLGYHFGHTVKWYVTAGKPGFVFQLDLPGQSILSDDSWRVQTAKAWDRNAPFRSTVGFNSEIFDAGRISSDWTQPGFTANAWDRATVLGQVPQSPWGTMIKRTIPYFLETEVAKPIEMVAVGQGRVSTEFEPHARIREQLLSPLKECSVQKLDHDQILPIAINTVEDKVAAFVVDYGGMVTGRPYLEIEAPAGVEIDIFYSGRFNPELGQLDEIPGDRYVGREKNADRIITRGGSTSWEGFDFKAFRYMELHVRKAPEGMKIVDLGVRVQEFNFEAEGNVSTSDEFINHLYDVSKQTIRHCAHDVFMDGPERERAGWIGDAAMQMVFAWYTFGDYGENSLTEKVFQQTVWHPTPGFTGRYSHHPPEGHSLLPGQMLWLFQRIYPYYLHSGRKEFVEKMYPHMIDFANFFGQRLDNRGIIDASYEGMQLKGGYWCWIDWADVAKTPRNPDEPDVGAILILNAQYKMLLDDLVKVAELCGSPAEVDEWTTARDRFVDNYDGDIWWNDKRGCFVDAEKEGAKMVSQQANAMAILSGLATESQVASIIENVFLGIRQKESRDIDRGRQQTIGECSPYSISYVVPALVQAGRPDLALGLIRDKYHGLNTPWLNSTPEYWWLNTPTGGFDYRKGASMCHGWGASPSFFLPALFAGIQPEEPGFSTFRFSPQLTDIETISAIVPTPAGMIESEVKLEGQTLLLRLTVPETSSATVEVPKRIMVGAFAPQATVVKINDGLAWESGKLSVLPAGVTLVEETDGAIIFRVPSGSWKFEARR